MPKAPESYLNSRRPPLKEALVLEDKETLKEALDSLTDKGYFAPPPGPWQLGFKDRGLGRGDFAVFDRFGDLVVLTKDRDTAQLIIEAVNAHRSK